MQNVVWAGRERKNDSMMAGRYQSGRHWKQGWSDVTNQKQFHHEQIMLNLISISLLPNERRCGAAVAAQTTRT